MGTVHPADAHDDAHDGHDACLAEGRRGSGDGP